MHCVDNVHNLSWKNVAQLNVNLTFSVSCTSQNLPSWSSTATHFDNNNTSCAALFLPQAIIKFDNQIDNDNLLNTSAQLKVPKSATSHNAAQL